MSIIDRWMIAHPIVQYDEIHIKWREFTHSYLNIMFINKLLIGLNGRNIDQFTIENFFTRSKSNYFNLLKRQDNRTFSIAEMATLFDILVQLQQSTIF